MKTYTPQPTGIDWADRVWNPVTGCTQISEGCDNCYAKSLAETRLRGRAGYPEDNPFQVVVHQDRIDGYRPGCKGQRIFVCSMSDLFHGEVDLLTTLRVFEKIREDQGNTYIVLTKRPLGAMDAVQFEIDNWWSEGRDEKWTPAPNLWLGVTAENQARADQRIPQLLQIPAALHFVSFEPLLGPIVLRPEWLSRLDWAIIGAESGPRRRPCELEWVESLVSNCCNNDVRVFYKQGPGDDSSIHPLSSFNEYKEFSKLPRIFGLDWQEFPEVAR